MSTDSGRTFTHGHAEDDPLLGQPLCADCYDYAAHLVWQWKAPDLWRRFTIALRRSVAAALGVPATALDDVATVQYPKVAEYQRRCAIHFHAVIRLDGPATPTGFSAAVTSLEAVELAALVRSTAASVRLTVDGVDDDDPARTLAFGRQVDARHVTARHRPDSPALALTAEQVAGYLAKYSTKSATDDPVLADSPHHRRLRATCRGLAARAKASGADDDYEQLAGWEHMYGFRGHFATKSRRYSVTLTALRRARRRAQALIADSRSTGRPLDLAALEADLLADEDTSTTLVVGSWQFVGTGWNSDAERTLAVAAAARAREHDQWRAEHRKSPTTTHEGGDR